MVAGGDGLEVEPKEPTECQALGVDRLNRPDDGRGDALLVEVEVASAALDPPGVHQDAGRMNDRVQTRQATGQHVGVGADTGE